MKKKKTCCSLCEQIADIYTTAHKTKPFADGKLYDKICFTCFFVPKTIEQVYDSKGSVKEEIEVPYSCENLHTPKELYSQGSSETLKQAKKSVESVTNACKTCKKTKDLKRPNADWVVG